MSVCRVLRSLVDLHLRFVKRTIIVVAYYLCFIFLQGDDTSVVYCRKCEAAARIVVDCCQSRSAYEHHFRALAPQVEWHYC